MQNKLIRLMVIGSVFTVFGTGAAFAEDPASADVTTLAKLHADNQMEIEHGKLAAEKGKSAQVKAFGRKLVADHTAADKKLLAYCKKTKVDEQALETATKAETDKAASDPSMAKLHDAAGEDFDQQFTTTMAAEHGKSIELVTSARDATGDAALKQMLTKLLPVLEKHKATAEKIAAKPNKT